MNRLPDLEIGATYASPNGMRRVRIAGFIRWRGDKWRVIEGAVESTVEPIFFIGWKMCATETLAQWAELHGFVWKDAPPETERSPMAEES